MGGSPNQLEDGRSPMSDIEFIKDWFHKAIKNAQGVGKLDSAALWADGLAHIEDLQAKLEAAEALIADLQADSKAVTVRVNARLEEQARKLAEALENLSFNFNAVGTPPQPWLDMIDSWHYIARKALEEKP